MRDLPAGVQASMLLSTFFSFYKQIFQSYLTRWLVLLSFLIAKASMFANWSAFMKCYLRMDMFCVLFDTFPILSLFTKKGWSVFFFVLHVILRVFK